MNLNQILKNKKIKSHSLIFYNSTTFSFLNSNTFVKLKKILPLNTIVEVLQLNFTFDIAQEEPVSVLNYLENKEYYGLPVRFSTKEILIVSLDCYNEKLLSELKREFSAQGFFNYLPEEVLMPFDGDFVLKMTPKKDLKNIANLQLPCSSFVTTVRGSVLENKFTEVSQEVFLFLDSSKDIEAFEKLNFSDFKVEGKDFFEISPSNSVLYKTTDWVIEKGSKIYSIEEIQELFRLNFSEKEKTPFYKKTFHSFKNVNLFDSYWNFPGNKRITAVMGPQFLSESSGGHLYLKLLLNELILNKPIISCIDVEGSPVECTLKRLCYEKSFEELPLKKDTLQLNLAILEKIRKTVDYDRVSDLVVSFLSQLLEGNSNGILKSEDIDKIEDSTKEFLALDIPINKFFIDYILDFYEKKSPGDGFLMALKEFSSEGAFNCFFEFEEPAVSDYINLNTFRTELQINLPFSKPELIAGAGAFLSFINIFNQLSSKDLNLIVMDLSKIQKRFTSLSNFVIESVINRLCEDPLNHFLVYLRENTHFNLQDNCYQKFMAKLDVLDIDEISNNWKVAPSELIILNDLKSNQFWFKKEKDFPYVICCEFSNFEKILGSNNGYLDIRLANYMRQGNSLLQSILKIVEN